MTKKLRVLVVDDSATVRRTLTQILESDPAIEVPSGSSTRCPTSSRSTSTCRA